MNIKDLLSSGIKILKECDIQEPILKTKIILEYVLKKDRQYITIHEDEVIDSNFEIIFNKLIYLAGQGLPIQYIINKQEFMKIDFYVNTDVLIPQPDTEILVEKVIEICNEQFSNKEKIEILDMCTGSGAIAISIAKYVPNSYVIGTEISKAAILVASKNAIDSKLENINIICSDMFKDFKIKNTLRDKKFDIIVSNPPYIQTNVINTLSNEVNYEPKIALDGGKDGLKFYRILSKDAHKYLKVGGFLALEIGYDQAQSVTELLQNENKYTNIQIIKDLSDNNRVIMAQKI